MAKTKKKKPVTQGDALVAIAGASPKALKVTGDVMEQANKQTLEILERQLQAEIAAHNETRRRLLQVKHRLDTIQARIAWVMGDSLPDETLTEIWEELDKIQNPE